MSRFSGLLRAVPLMVGDNTPTTDCVLAPGEFPNRSAIGESIERRGTAGEGERGWGDAERRACLPDGFRRLRSSYS